jgi:hypothetical protein
MKRLPKDREAEFSDKAASLRAKLTKLERRIKGGGE